ncbi:MAG: hypothetical protein R3F59_39065, partial [Myxococcota bacterium]
METFEPEDGPICYGPFATRAAVEALLDAGLAAAGQVRAPAYDRGNTDISRLYEGADGWWLAPGRMWALVHELPADLPGVAARLAYDPEDEWGRPVGARVYRVRGTVISEALPSTASDS